LKSAGEVTPHFYTDTPAAGDYSEAKPSFTPHHRDRALQSPKVSISWPGWIAKVSSLIPWSDYLHHIFTLVLAGLGYLGVIYLVTHVDPARIANLPLPHFYLPLQALFLISNVLLFSFVWLNSRRGLLTALWLQIQLFLKLQLVIVSWQLALMLLIVFVIIEGLGTWYDRHSTSDHANLKQTTFHRRRRTHS